MTITINFENHLWFLIFALAEKMVFSLPRCRENLSSISHSLYGFCYLPSFWEINSRFLSEKERRVWSYQRDTKNPYIEQQTTEWPKQKVQKDKQRSTKHTHKTENRLTNPT